MAQITNYSTLQTEIANFLDRSDLTADVPTFIQLGEARLNQTLRIRPMETRVTTSTVAGQNYYGLPDNYIQMRAFVLDTSPRRDLEYLTPETMDVMWAGSKTGVPQAYTIVGDAIRLGPTPSGVVTLEMVFWAKIPALSATNTSNWYIENAPNLLLAAAMIEAAMFIKDPELLVTWKAYYEISRDDIVVQDSKDRHSGGALFMRSVHMGA